VFQAPGPNPVTPIRVAQVHKEGRLMTWEEIEGRHRRPPLTRSGSSTPGGIPSAPGPLPLQLFSFPLPSIDTRVRRPLDGEVVSGLDYLVGRARLMTFASHEKEGVRWALPPPPRLTARGAP
jgi:hypothetical protein